MFETHQFDAKQIRFIGRYAELYGLIEIQIEQLATLRSQDETLGKTIAELEKSRDDFARRRHLVKERLQQIAENPIYVEEEIELLREIEEIREELAVVKHKFSWK